MLLHDYVVFLDISRVSAPVNMPQWVAGETSLGTVFYLGALVRLLDPLA